MILLYCCLWFLWWVIFGLGISRTIAVGGSYDITAEDKHYNSSGRYIGSTKRKTGEGYADPNPGFARVWLIVSLVIFLAITIYLKWTPFHWMKTDAATNL